MVHAYPWTCMFVHHPCLAVQRSLSVPDSVIGQVRRAHVSHYFVTIEDHIRAWIEAGPVVMLSCQPDGWSTRPAQALVGS